MKELLLKVNQALLFWILLIVVLVYGRQMLVPLTFAAMLTMLMVPVIDWLDKLGLKRIYSTILCLVFLFTLIALVLLILTAQITSFVEDMPQIEAKLNDLITSLNQYIASRYDLPVQEQQDILKKQVQAIGQSSATYLKTIVTGATGTLVNLAITLVVTFLLLFDKEKYKTFFIRLLNNKATPADEETLDRISRVAQQYLFGRLLSMFVLFVLYFIALLIIGVKNALMLSALAALVNIIPYIGPLLAAVFPMLAALITNESYEPVIWVVITFTIIQGIDNYFVTPVVMGGEVSLSALATILIIICGGYIWGVAGMILFVPMLSIAKIIFDRVEPLKPYGYLIGDPSGETPSIRIRRWLSKKMGK